MFNSSVSYRRQGGKVYQTASVCRVETDRNSGRRIESTRSTGILLHPSPSNTRKPGAGRLWETATECRFSFFSAQLLSLICSSPSAVEFAFTYDTEVIVEEEVDGSEVGCAILGDEVLTVGRVDEVIRFPSLSCRRPPAQPAEKLPISELLCLQG